jgi:16S rRNA processing protein RimM
MESDFLLMGKLGKPHGLRGQVKFHSYGSSHESFFPGRTVYLSRDLEMNGRVINEVKFQARSLLLKFEGVDNRDQAQGLCDYSLYFHKNDLQPLPEGEYYWCQLIGCRVYNEHNGFLGVMEGVFPTTGHDIWVIRDGVKEMLLPAVDDFILSVNQTQKVIRVRELDGPSEGNDR